MVSINIFCSDCGSGWSIRPEEKKEEYYKLLEMDKKCVFCDSTNIKHEEMRIDDYRNRQREVRKPKKRIRDGNN